MLNRLSAKLPSNTRLTCFGGTIWRNNPPGMGVIVFVRRSKTKPFVAPLLCASGNGIFADYQHQNENIDYLRKMAGYLRKWLVI
jgi:hypothetical protein